MGECLEALGTSLEAYGGLRGIPGVFLGDPWAPVGFLRISWGAWEAIRLPGGGLTVLPGPTRLLSTLTASQLRARSLGLSAAMEPRGLSRLVGPLD